MKHRINIPVGYLLSVSCLSLLLAVGGCESGEPSPTATDPVEVNLFTKAPATGSEASVSYRLLVFNEGSQCVKNISFVPGSSSVTLDAGTYRFAALNVPEGLSLPAAGTPEGITPESALGFGSNPVREFRISVPEQVTVGEGSAAYTASLVPVTAVMSLKLSNLPSGKEVKFKLSNMYTSVKLSDLTYSGETAYPLNLDGETACFPCKGAVELTYTVDGGVSKTIYTGSSLEAGNRLSLNLAWSEDARVFLLLSSTVDDWTGGGNESGTAQ